MSDADAKKTADPPEVLARMMEAQPLVPIIARQLARLVGAHADHDDLVSNGSEALLLAARSFDETRGIPFRRWANLRIRGAMMDGIRSQGNLPRRVYKKVRAMQAAEHVREAASEEAPPATPEAADAKLGDQLSASAMAMALGFLTMRRGDAALEEAKDTADSPEQAVANAELGDLLKRLIDERPDVERKLLTRHYFDDVTIDEAAKELGLSRSWGSRIHARAVEGVAKALKRAKIGV